jgi:small neutral amino acid transporter SnatA (MarC family)
VNELAIAGGILLFIVALRGVLARGSAYRQSSDSHMLAVFPIAFPMMVGPGTITMTIITTQTIGRLPMIVTAVVTFAAVFLIARNADRLMRLMGSYAGIVMVWPASSNSISHRPPHERIPRLPQPPIPPCVLLTVRVMNRGSRRR